MEPQERAAKIEELIAQCHSTEYSTVIDALQELERLEASEAAHHVLFLLQDHDAVLRSATAEFLGKIADIGDEIVGDALVAVLQNPDDFARNSVAEALGELLIKKSAPQLIELLRDPEELVRTCAVEAVGAFRDPLFFDSIISMLNDESELVRAYAAEAVARKKHSRALGVLQAHRETEDGLYVHVWVLKALHDLGDFTATEELKSLFFYLDKIHTVAGSFYDQIVADEKNALPDV